MQAVSYISSAELARRCDVSRAAVAIAIKEHRIDPAKVRRAGGRVMVEQAHGFSVLGHHAKSRPSPSPRPAAVAAAPAADEFSDLLAWGAAPIMPEADADELTGAAEVADLLEQINQWDELVKEKEQMIKRWEMAYENFREWITAEAAKNVMQHLEENQIARNAVCDAIAVVQKKLRDELDAVHYQSGLK